MRGLYLSGPHPELIYDGTKRAIVKPRIHDGLSGERRVLVGGGSASGRAFGEIELSEPVHVTAEQFDGLFQAHRITPRERARWWPDEQEFALYPVAAFEPYDDPVPVDVPPGVQTTMAEVNFSGERPEKGRGWSMPYEVSMEVQEGKHCVVKEGTTEIAPGGCHDTHEEAVAHMTALNIATEGETKEMGMIAPLGGATTFAEADALEAETAKAMHMHDLVGKLQAMTANIMASDIEDKAAAVRSLMDEFAGRAEVLQSKEAKQAPKKTEDGSVKELTFMEQVVNAVKSVLGIQSPEENKAAQSQTGLLVWKGDTGAWHWIARYSNNLRDDDQPPEIISGDSHKSFVGAVDAGTLPLPELWLWHQPEWKVGKARWVATDEDARGVVWALAGGLFDKGREWVAELLANKDADEVRVSHGMPPSSIERDQKDSTIFVQHQTVEISPLPRWAAANRWTTFHAGEVGDMSIPDEKRKALIEQWGVDAAKLEALEATNAGDATKALEQEIEIKEADDGAEGAVEQEAQPAPEPEGEPEPEPQYVTRDEVAEAMQPLVEAVNAVTQGLGEIVGEVKALKESRTDDIADAAQKAAEMALSPATSLADMIRSSIIGSDAARVKDTDGEQVRKGAPKETEAPDLASGTGIPFIDAMRLGKDWRDGIPSAENE